MLKKTVGFNQLAAAGEAVCTECRLQPGLGRHAGATGSGTPALPTNPSLGVRTSCAPILWIPHPTTVPSASSPGVFLAARSFTGLEEISPCASGCYFHISRPVGADTRARWARGRRIPQSGCWVCSLEGLQLAHRPGVPF